jgi:hypothetical protein
MTADLNQTTIAACGEVADLQEQSADRRASERSSRVQVSRSRTPAKGWGVVRASVRCQPLRGSLVWAGAKTDYSVAFPGRCPVCVPRRESKQR